MTQDEILAELERRGLSTNFCGQKITAWTVVELRIFIKVLSRERVVKARATKVQLCVALLRLKSGRLTSTEVQALDVVRIGGSVKKAHRILKRGSKPTALHALSSKRRARFFAGQTQPVVSKKVGKRAQNQAPAGTEHSYTAGGNGETQQMAVDEETVPMSSAVEARSEHS